MKQTCELRLVKKDRTEFYVLMESVLSGDGKDTMNKFRTIINDITKRKEAEKKIKELKGFYQLILDGLETGIWVTDKNDVIYYTNKGMTTTAGISPKEIEGVN